MGADLYNAWYICEDLEPERFNEARHKPMYVKYLKQKVGNYFKTEEEARRVSDAIKTLVNLKKP